MVISLCCSVAFNVEVNDSEIVFKNLLPRFNIYELDQLLFCVSGSWMFMCLSFHFIFMMCRVWRHVFKLSFATSRS